MQNNKNCKNCRIFHKPTIVKTCSVCKDLKFQENILCELVNAGIEENENFSCPEFKPFLSVVGGINLHKKTNTAINENSTDKTLRNKIKWFKAYALQQLKMNPDQIHAQIKYHVCLVSRGRGNIFNNHEIFFENMVSTFYDIGFLFESKIYLIGVSDDHIHFFIDSSPEYPADKIVNKIIDGLNREFLKIFPKAKEKYNRVFEKNYFIETVG